MKKLDNIIDNKIAQNIFLWFCLYFIFATTIQTNNRFVISFYIMLLLAPAIYLNNLFILPFLQKNKFVFITLFFINAIVFSFISVFLINHYSQSSFELKMLINFLGIMILAVAFGTATKIARDSFLRRQQNKEAELQLLKGQLNPHFLFNTLNNLYGLSVLKSDKLPSLMLKLSDLLRYSLYETKEKLVSLEKEIKYLKNYMSLEKIRLEDKTEITFNQSGDFTNKKIAPMLLIVFVENAFKHLEINNSFVKVNLEVDEKKLTFNCTNTFDSNQKTIANLETGKSGIGLQNAKKRLDLIYSNKHILKIEKENNSYKVNLTLTF